MDTLIQHISSSISDHHNRASCLYNDPHEGHKLQLKIKVDRPATAGKFYALPFTEPHTNGDQQDINY